MSGAPRAPRVTVVMATYNWAPVLPYSIGSVLDQTLTDFELLVVGDGCTDESAQVVGAMHDPRVEWVNLAHNTGHQWGPNNEGLRRARGAVVAYLGHDDLWLPHHLEVLVPVVEGGAVAAHTSALTVDTRGITILPRAGWSYTPGEWIPPASFAVARRALVEAGGWRSPRDTGDVDPEADLLARIAAHAGPPAWVPRLTCVKLPASTRPNVYRTRPSFEQEHWLRIIRESADPEATLRATEGGPYPWIEPPARPPRLPTRAWRSLRRRLRAAWRARHGSAAPRGALDRYRRNRRHKGL